MAQMGRPGLSAEQKVALWTRWKNGQSFSEIGRELGKHAASIFGVVAQRGGIAPPNRRRSPGALTLSEREEISRGIAVGTSIRQTAVYSCFGILNIPVLHFDNPIQSRLEDEISGEAHPQAPKRIGVVVNFYNHGPRFLAWPGLVGFDHCFYDETSCSARLLL